MNILIIIFIYFNIIKIMQKLGCGRFLKKFFKELLERIFQASS